MGNPKHYRSNNGLSDDHANPLKPRSTLGLLKYLIVHMSIEPALFCIAGGLNVYGVLMSTGIYWKVCQQEFGNDSRIDCHQRNFSADPHAEYVLQEKTAEVILYISLAQALPILISGPLYGAYGDKYGRKLNLVISLFGLLAFAALNFLQFTFPASPLYIYPLASFFICFAGFIGVLLASAFAYVTDETKDHDILTMRLTGLTVISSLADVAVGSVTGAVIYYLSSYAQAMLIPVALWVVAMLYILVVIKQVPPDQHQKGSSPSDTLENGSLTTKTPLMDEATNPESLDAPVNETLMVPAMSPKKDSGIIQEVLVLLRGSIQAATKQRDGRLRMYIWVTVLAFLILNSAQMGLVVVLNLFCLHTPLSWGPSEIAYYFAFNSVVQLFGTVLGSFIMKNVFHMHESGMLIVTLISAILKVTIIGFSVHSSLMYVAAVLGALSNLTFPVCKSLVVQFVDRNEVGKIYALLQIATDFSIIFSYSGFSALYAATVAYHQGIVFVCISAAAVLTLIPVIFVHVDFRRYRRARIGKAGAGI